MKIRMHRGSLRESMSTVKEIPPNITAISKYLAANGFVSHRLEVVPYSFDHRNQWDTHLVTADGAPVAWTNGPLSNAPIEEQSMSTDQQIEEEIAAKGLTAERVTPAQIEATIVDTQYWNPPGTNLTVCVLTLRNGYNVVGESACVANANFDVEIGRKIALADAKNKIWGLEGYVLAERRYFLKDVDAPAA